MINKNTMTKYNVLIEETLARTVEVEAKDEQEAEEKVQTMYDAQEIVLDHTDFSNLLIREENCE